MRTLAPLDATTATAALERLHRHAPVAALPPRFLLAAPHGADSCDGDCEVVFLGSDASVWWSQLGRGSRLVRPRHGDGELTEWAWRVEVSRVVATFG